MSAENFHSRRALGIAAEITWPCHDCDLILDPLGSMCDKFALTATQSQLPQSSPNVPSFPPRTACSTASASSRIACMSSSESLEPSRVVSHARAFGVDMPSERCKASSRSSPLKLSIARSTSGSLGRLANAFLTAGEVANAKL